MKYQDPLLYDENDKIYQEEMEEPSLLGTEVYSPPEWEELPSLVEEKIMEPIMTDKDKISEEELLIYIEDRQNNMKADIISSFERFNVQGYDYQINYELKTEELMNDLLKQIDAKEKDNELIPYEHKDTITYYNEEREDLRIIQYDLEHDPNTPGLSRIEATNIDKDVLKQEIYERENGQNRGREY